MSHPDTIYESFVMRQAALLAEFAQLNPDLLRVEQRAANAWLIELRCKGLIRKPGHDVEERDCFHVGILLSPDYCRRVDPSVVTLLTPHVWHPNVHWESGGICLGRIRPATAISELVTQVVEIITYLNFTPREEDALCRDACQWARNHKGERFPLERRGIHLPKHPVS